MNVRLRLFEFLWSRLSAHTNQCCGWTGGVNAARARSNTERFVAPQVSVPDTPKEVAEDDVDETEEQSGGKVGTQKRVSRRKMYGHLSTHFDPTPNDRRAVLKS